MRKLVRPALTLVGLAIALALSVGCAKSGANLVGNWKGSLQLPKSSNAAADGMANAMVSAMASNITLNLKGDGTFSMNMIFPIEGNWSVTGSKLSLIPTKLMGMSVDDMKKQQPANGSTMAASSSAQKPLVFDVSADGKTLTGQDSDPSKGSLTMTRS